jgi:cystathionine beta-lyase
MIDYVIGNVGFVDEYLRTHIPAIKVFMPQASFLIWLDCRELRLSQRQLVSLFIDGAGLALNDGEMFGLEGTGFMRINIGCPRDTLADALTRLKNALASVSAAV